MSQPSGEVCEIPAYFTTTKEVASVLKDSKVVAIVGLSANPSKDSHIVAQYLLRNGYKIIPVNPNHDRILGLKCYHTLSEIPTDMHIDVVDIFRPPSVVPPIVEAAIERKAKVVWMQEGIVNNKAAERALSAGLRVIMNKCMMKEHKALHR